MYPFRFCKEYGVCLLTSVEKPNVDFKLTVAGAVADNDIPVAKLHVISNDPVFRIASSLSNFLSSSPSQHLFRIRTYVAGILQETLLKR